MKRGIVYVVFGVDFAILAEQTIKYTRKYTDLPITVLTNIRNCKINVSKLNTIYFNKNISENRDIKTRMIDYTPYNETLYIDTDSVVRKEGIEKAFDCLGENDIALNLLVRWEKGEKVVRIYKKAMIQLGCKLPFDVYNGGIICFRKSEKMKIWFRKWNYYWILNGKNREMPSLNCLLQKNNLRISRLPEGFFAPDIRNENCIVQHNYNSHNGFTFTKEFGLPNFRSYKRLDKKEDWNWVEL